MAKKTEVKLVFKGVDKVSGKLKRINNSLRKFRIKAGLAKVATRGLTAAQRGLSKVSGFLRGKFVALAAALGGLAIAKKVLSDFIAFEKGLFGIQKTTGLSGKALKKFGREIQNISKDLPVTQSSLLELAKTAGQLGVKNKDLIKFTRTMGELQLATDIVGEDGAKALARVLNVTGEGVESVDRFGSSLVDLGNNFAATESEILRATNEVARGTSQFKIGAANAAGLGTALASLGVRAEAGGTVITNSFIQIEEALKKGGASAKLLSTITGESVKDLKKQFAEDATGVFQKFLVGLKKVKDGQGNTTRVLKAFNLTGARVSKVLIPLALRSDILADAVNKSNTAWEENKALTNEVAIQNKSLDSQIKRVMNRFTAFRTQLGEKFGPLLAETAKKFADFFDTLGSAEVQTVFEGLKLIAKGVGIALLPLRALVFLLGKASSLLGQVGGALGIGISGPEPTETFTPNQSDIDDKRKRLQGLRTPEANSQISKIRAKELKDVKGQFKLLLGPNVPPGTRVEGESENAELEVGRTGSG